jgi:hypothetical protein
MSFLFAPHRNNLGHDAREIGIHQACEQRPIRSFGDKVDDANM